MTPSRPEVTDEPPSDRPPRDAGIAESPTRRRAPARPRVRRHPEYDNPLPGWWVTIFAGSIVFAVVLRASTSTSRLGRDAASRRYQAALADYEDKRASARAGRARRTSPRRRSRRRRRATQRWSRTARRSSQQRCVVCHGDRRRAALIGPNLTDLLDPRHDPRWTSTRRSRRACRARAMPAWGEQLAPTDVARGRHVRDHAARQERAGQGAAGRRRVEPFAAGACHDAAARTTSACCRRSTPTARGDWIRPQARARPVPAPAADRRLRADRAVRRCCPWIKIGGQPGAAARPRRRASSRSSGATFRPTDGVLADAARADDRVRACSWSRRCSAACGAAGRCPQTVYLECVFRPIERWLEGTPAPAARSSTSGGLHLRRRRSSTAIFCVLAFVLANVFLAYFVGTDAARDLGARVAAAAPRRVRAWSSASPALMFFDFAYFREQTCIVVCPYGRLQSVLLDRQSLIVGYDARRGEPRGKPKKQLTVVGERGDCVDCGACVARVPDRHRHPRRPADGVHRLRAVRRRLRRRDGQARQAARPDPLHVAGRARRQAAQAPSRAHDRSTRCCWSRSRRCWW